MPLSSDCQCDAQTDGAQQLRAFCESLLELMKPGQTNSAAPIIQMLVEVVSSGCHRAIETVRNEVQTLDETARRLRSVNSSALCRLGSEADVVLDRLEAHHRQLKELLGAIERLAGAPQLAQLPVQIRESSSTNEVIPLLPDEAMSVSTLEVSTTETIPVVEPTGRDDSLARHLFRDAETYRHQAEYSRAEETYSEVLSLKGDFFEARLNRGRVRVLLGKPEDAIRDLTDVLGARPDSSIALCWRADALALSKRYEQSIADYDRALDLQPGLIQAKYNRSVALRLCGQLARALEEFNEILRIQPHHAGAYLNRGIVHELMGNASSAASDFRKSLRYQPGSQEAIQRLQAVRVLLDVAPTPVPSSRTHAPVNKPTKIDLSDFEQGAADAKTAEIKTTEQITSTTPILRETQDSLKVRCPGCLNETTIRWNKLEAGRVLTCPHCSRSFTTRPSGELSEVIRTGGRWEFLQSVQRLRRGRREWRLRVSAVACVILLLACAFWWPSRLGRSSASVEAELPAELERRVELFAKAWHRGDSRTMRRLTDPTQDRLLFLWYRNNPSPMLPAQEKAAKSDTRFEVSKVADRHPLVWFDVKVQDAAPDGPMARAELKLAWEERGNTWFFLPAPRS